MQTNPFLIKDDEAVEDELLDLILKTIKGKNFTFKNSSGSFFYINFSQGLDSVAVFED